MELVKKTDNQEILKKRSGRYAVKVDGKYVNGKEKQGILLKAKLIKVSRAKAKPAKEAETKSE